MPSFSFSPEAAMPIIDSKEINQLALSVMSSQETAMGSVARSKEFFVGWSKNGTAENGSVGRGAAAAREISTAGDNNDFEPTLRLQADSGIVGRTTPTSNTNNLMQINHDPSENLPIDHRATAERDEEENENAPDSENDSDVDVFEQLELLQKEKREWIIKEHDFQHEKKFFQRKLLQKDSEIEKLEEDIDFYAEQAEELRAKKLVQIESELKEVRVKYGEVCDAKEKLEEEKAEWKCKYFNLLELDQSCTEGDTVQENVEKNPDISGTISRSGAIDAGEAAHDCSEIDEPNVVDGTNYPGAQAEHHPPAGAETGGTATTTPTAQHHKNLTKQKRLNTKLNKDLELVKQERNALLVDKRILEADAETKEQQFSKLSQDFRHQKKLLTTTQADLELLTDKFEQKRLEFKTLSNHFDLQKTQTSHLQKENEKFDLENKELKNRLEIVETFELKDLQQRNDKIELLLSVEEHKNLQLRALIDENKLRQDLAEQQQTSDFTTFEKVEQVGNLRQVELLGKRNQELESELIRLKQGKLEEVEKENLKLIKQNEELEYEVKKKEQVEIAKLTEYEELMGKLESGRILILDFESRLQQAHIFLEEERKEKNTLWKVFDEERAELKEKHNHEKEKLQMTIEDLRAELFFSGRVDYYKDLETCCEDFGTKIEFFETTTIPQKDREVLKLKKELEHFAKNVEKEKAELLELRNLKLSADMNLIDLQAWKENALADYNQNGMRLADMEKDVLDSKGKLAETKQELTVITKKRATAISVGVTADPDMIQYGFKRHYVNKNQQTDWSLQLEKKERKLVTEEAKNVYYDQMLVNSPVGAAGDHSPDNFDNFLYNESNSLFSPVSFGGGDNIGSPTSQTSAPGLARPGLPGVHPAKTQVETTSDRRRVLFPSSEVETTSDRRRVSHLCRSSSLSAAMVPWPAARVIVRA
ncbi:unnamed protein product [Amoebophrya sp. A120]|nr:unnamed protein product [Amoebophrya sp. A120]|eukprot:GSA120T00009549001.1